MGKIIGAFILFVYHALGGTLAAAMAADDAELGDYLYLTPLALGSVGLTWVIITAIRDGSL